MDITQVKRMLADRAQAVAEYLLPNGKKEGSEWRAGSVAGEAGQSLGVHLSGGKAGVWADFGSGESGDLIDLWVATRGLPLAEALDDARRWLGVARPEPYRDPKPSYTRPPKPKCTAPANRVLDYLREERNIPAEVIEAYRVGENGDDIIFPFLLPGGELALAKARKAEAGAKPKPTAANCEPVLFGWQAISETAREIIIAEGEIDALSWAAYGYPGMSVPFGGGKGAKQKWIENEFDRLERFERIYISMDMDQVGEEAAEEIASRLGRHRCFRIQLPRKDCNDCLMEGVPKADIDKAVKSASSLDPEGLKRAIDYTDSVIHLFWPASEEAIGYDLPYGKLFGKLNFRPAEVTLWTGSSGAGKSQVLSDSMVHWVNQGSRVCLSSLEMKPEQTLKRMCKQTGGEDRPVASQIQKIMTWLDRGLLIYDRVGKAGVEPLLEVFDYARAKYGCDQFVIDSLMRLGISGDDYNGQEKAMFLMVDWAISRNVHLHLVAHSRKADKDRGVPETEDVKGAMEIGANAFNIVTVWRNRKLEDEIRGAKTELERIEKKKVPGVILNVAKQRNGDFEGKVGLWFNQENYRYRSSFDNSDFSRFYPLDEREHEAA
ncbi:DNA primase [Hyphomicrobiales bacterium]|nr:DNA primase [Hyphomicrobiales bacterium]CAH1673329.1 DNA primase [Hyphomicrobiales bacterium]